jgi:hypothetical protein
LISEACQVPSSFNIRHWPFIAVTDERIRERPKGPRLRLIKRLEGIPDETVDAGRLPREVADVWSTMANGMYGSDPRLPLGRSDPIWFAGRDDAHACRWEPLMLAVGRPASGINPRRPRLPVEQVLAFNTSLE